MLSTSLFLPAFVALVGILFLVMPGLTRPEIFFSVTVAPEFRRTDEGRRATRTFRVVSSLSSLSSLAVVCLAAGSGDPWHWVALAFLLQLLGAAAGFLLSRHRVAPHAVAPATTREAALEARREGLPGGWPLQAVPFVLLAATAVVFGLRWQALPARFPIHWSLSGQPDRWANPTTVAAFGPVVLAALICGVMLGVARGVLASRRVHADGSAAQREARFRRLVALVLWTGEIAAALAASREALLAFPPRLGLERAFAIAVGGVAIALTVLVVHTVWLGQGGARRGPAPDGAAPVGDRTPDSGWKLGLFYANRADPSLFVEKRFGVGYTLNFGNPRIWLLLALLLGVAILIVVLTR
jgi:uncharacterized membrane protein